MDQRKCHICGKAGHIARACPDKDKGGKAAFQASNAVGASHAAHSLGVIMDDEGYQQVRAGHGVRQVTVGNFPPKVSGLSQRERKAANRFKALNDDGEGGYSNTQSK